MKFRAAHGTSTPCANQINSYYAISINYDEDITKFRDTNLMPRSRIPKLQHSRRLTSAVSIMNQQFFPPHLDNAQNMEELSIMLL